LLAIAVRTCDAEGRAIASPYKLTPDEILDSRA
jgi:hypothetical protein